MYARLRGVPEQAIPQEVTRLLSRVGLIRQPHHAHNPHRSLSCQEAGSRQSNRAGPGSGLLGSFLGLAGLGRGRRGVGEQADNACGRYSGGNKRKLALAAALVGHLPDGVGPRAPTLNTHARGLGSCWLRWAVHCWLRLA